MALLSILQWLLHLEADFRICRLCLKHLLVLQHFDRFSALVTLGHQVYRFVGQLGLFVVLVQRFGPCRGILRPIAALLYLLWEGVLVRAIDWTWLLF